LRIAWGLSAILAVGGWLVALEISTPFVLGGVLAIGLVALIALREKDEAFALSRLLVLTLVGLTVFLVTKVAVESPEPCDDHMAYYQFVEQLRATGGMEQPFSFRRLAAYGGQNFLQELTTLTGDWHNYMALEVALAPVIVFALLLGEMTKRRLYLPSFIVIAYLLTANFHVIRWNSASEATTALLILTLLRTLKLIEEGAGSRKLLIIAGLIAAAVSTMRDSNLAFPAILFGLFMLTQHRLLDWKRHLAVGLTFGLSWIFFLVPWAIALMESSGTPLYPFIKGYHHADFETYALGGSLSVWLSHAQGVIAYMPLTLAIAAGTAAFGRSKLPALGLATAVINGVALIVAFSAASVWPLTRYIHPSVVAAMLFSLSIMLSVRLKLSPMWEKIVTPAGMVLIVGHASLLLLAYFSREPTPWSQRDEAYEARIALYRAAQAQVPPGDKILVWVAGPFGFDQARNPIINLDHAGPISPPPGMPFFKGPEALAQYLQGLGIRYVIYDDFDVPLDVALNKCVVRPKWTSWATEDDPLLQKLSPYGLDAMRNLDSFGAQDKVLFRENGVTLVEPLVPASPTQ
jgi:hypothetical protein